MIKLQNSFFFIISLDEVVRLTKERKESIGINSKFFNDNAFVNFRIPRVVCNIYTWKIRRGEKNTKIKKRA